MRFELSTSVALLASASVVTAQCNLPTTYKWTSTGALTQPKNGWASIKDCEFAQNIHSICIS